MNKKKIIQKGGAAALALTLALAAMILPQVRAAVAIDTEAECSVTFQVDTEGEGSFAELAQIPIPVSLYRVAEVSEFGEYKALSGFEALELDSVTSETTAAEWEEKAAAAMEVVTAAENAGAPLQADAAAEIKAQAEGEDPAATVSGLDTGMYLVAAEEVESARYTYSFTPYLLALPDNYYDSSVEGSSDAWIYDAVTGLKPEQNQRFGDLQINKTLTSYNETLQGASFVFSVEAELDGENVYSDVVSMVFDGTGSKTVLVEELPAGAEVTVTEIYSGASYSLTADTAQVQQAEIVADGEEGAPASVSFKNEYSNKINGGSSVENHFAYTSEDGSQAGPDAQSASGSWSWIQRTDSTDSGAAAQE